MKSHSAILPVLVVLLSLTLPLPWLASAATVAVTDCGDSGAAGQLRQVIAGAGSGDTINVPACTITLTTPASPLTINTNLTITGAGAPKTIIDGGGITQIFQVNFGATVAMSGLTVRQGTGLVGGGISSEGALTLTDTVITENNASFQGGGIDAQSPLTLINSTVSGNTALLGGGLSVQGPTIIMNTTVSGNTSTDASGGGGVASGASTSVVNSTITGNHAPAGDGGGIKRFTGGVTLRNTVVADNTAAAGANCAGGSIVSIGNNLESANDCGFNPLADLINTNPLLGPLQLNGGPTPTHALLPGSPAIDAGNNLGCPSTDQRGVPRPLETTLGFRTCDIGAFEVETLGFIHANLILNTASVHPGTPLQGTVSVTNVGGARPLDAYVVFVPPAAAGPSFGCPGGDALIFLTGSGATLTCASSGVQTFAPFVSNVSLPADLFTPVSGSVFSLVWPSGAPTGPWSAALALTPVGAFADGRVNPAADIVIAPAAFTVSP